MLWNWNMTKKWWCFISKENKDIPIFLQAFHLTFSKNCNSNMLSKREFFFKILPLCFKVDVNCYFLFWDNAATVYFHIYIDHCSLLFPTLTTNMYDVISTFVVRYMFNFPKYIWKKTCNARCFFQKKYQDHDCPWRIFHLSFQEK